VSNTTDATSGAGTAYPSGAPEFTPFFSAVRVTRSLVLFLMFCRSLFVLFLLAIVLSVLWYTDSDYPFGVFKIFFDIYMPVYIKTESNNFYCNELSILFKFDSILFQKFGHVVTVY